MRFMKTVKNNTRNTITVGLAIRPHEGASLEVDQKIVWCTLHPGESTVLELADQEQMPHVNALCFRSSGSDVTVAFRVAEKSKSFDNTLNTNDTIYITSLALGDIKVEGSNT